MLEKDISSGIKEEIEKEGEKQAVDMEEFRRMIDAGLFYGRKKTKTHPNMRDVIFTNRGNIEIIDLIKTISFLKTAMDFISEEVGKGGKILFVGTQPAVKSLIKEAADKFDFPYVNERWIGGTLTNFNVIKKRVDYFKDLKLKRENKELGQYTKKERMEIDKEIERMEKNFSGIAIMNKLPEVLFVINLNFHRIVIREAKRMKIPIVGVVNTDADYKEVDYPIPANDNSMKATRWILERLERAIEEGKKKVSAGAGESGNGENNN